MLNTDKSRWQVGDRIGGLYEVREILGGPGKTGMGTVYICYYPWHQKLYALKTYQPQFATIERIGRLFYKEATLWMQIGAHRNIVKAHWVHQLDDQIFVVMEYVQRDRRGRLSLSDHLSGRKPLPLLRALIWAFQLCVGMVHAAKHGVEVHRDLKPDNLLITLDKILKITDFGLAKAFAGAAEGGGAIGTPLWMAPEQFANADACTVRSDVYAFGIILYQMASGFFPFLSSKRDNDFFREMRTLHEKADVPKLEHSLFPIIEKCLEKRPENRYASFEQLQGELASVWRTTTGVPVPVVEASRDSSAPEINQHGVALKHLGRPKEALIYHDRAILIDPVFPNAWNDKGVAFWSIDQHEQAMHCFDTAISLDPEFVHPVSNKAGLLCTMGDIEQGTALYERATQLDPDFLYAWTGLANQYEKADRWPDALRCYNRIVKLNARNSVYWLRRGLALFQLVKAGHSLGDIAEAKRCAKEALALNSGFGPAQQFLILLDTDDGAT
jgi:serine/threonine protein kinase